MSFNRDTKKLNAAMESLKKAVAKQFDPVLEPITQFEQAGRTAPDVNKYKEAHCHG